MSDTWPFDQDRNAAAITTKQVIEDGMPFLMVVHYDDDHSWAFTCGTSDDPEDGRVITMEEALERDASLATIADLEPGWCAWRDDETSAWESCPLDGEVDQADAR